MTLTKQEPEIEKKVRALKKDLEDDGYTEIEYVRDANGRGLDFSFDGYRVSVRFKKVEK